MNSNDDPSVPKPPPFGGFDGLDPGELLARGLNTVQPTGGSHAWTPPTPEELAAILPQYRIESLLGHGGMGAVYRGVQTALERPVAIKLLPLEVSADRDFADRFVREARTLARLSHPNIVAVHDFGKTSAGHLYFVMEFVEGTNLHQMIHGPGLAPAQALRIIISVCEALQYAHGKGVVHRDIKPANVMISTESQVKVADFGLARLNNPAADDWGHTMTGTVMGTPDYMAPEQTRGMAVDHRADIYSLGVMLYEMLCGEVPRGVFEPPSRKVQVDVRFDEVVLRAMQSEPERRYQNTGEMKTDVDAIRTAPLPTAPPAPPAKPKSRTPAMVAVVTACLAFAGAGGFFIWRQGESSSGGKRTVVSPTSAPASTGKVDAAGAAPFAPTPATANRDRPFINTLGMKFVPVPGAQLLFCIHETRKADYAAYSAAFPSIDNSWKTPRGPDMLPVSTTGEHPVVAVNEEEAMAFCAWLSKREGRTYRLPTDHEWSCAVGIADSEDATASPDSKSGRIPRLFPWGTEWPPPPGAGNFADSSLRDALLTSDQRDRVIAGYSDGFATTAPVMSFKPNALGIYDLAGNVWERTSDWFNPTHQAKAQRGGCWGNAPSDDLLSCYRNPLNHIRYDRNNLTGFRVVLEEPPGTGKVDVGARLPAAESPQITSSTATKDAPLVNTLGMKFVPVPIAGGPMGGQRVLFSVWETRVQDYQSFAKETKRQWPIPDFAQGATHPAVMVSWEDAQAFCAWLTERERKAGKLAANERYRLPLDHEWSCAARIGDREDPAQTPSAKDGRIKDIYPWGGNWPPQERAGNYSGEEAATHETHTMQKILSGYRDEFPVTAPVGSFAANANGLFDLGGNATEWCEELVGIGGQSRTLRGASFSSGNRLLSSERGSLNQTYRTPEHGFRVVLAPTAP